MDIVLSRSDMGSGGVFGQLQTVDGKFICFTGEHAYEQDNGSFLPKLALGSYKCLLGTHQLLHSPAPFRAYEILDVPDFMNEPVTKILLHIGNLPQTDSDGCVLLGTEMGTIGGLRAVINSKWAFIQFMQMQSGNLSFGLTVV
jgi:uncharacterized protein DUF5675